MTKPVPGIKIQYLQEEQYPEVEGLRCVQVKIPDDDTYMAVLAGLISQASKWFNYARKDKTKARAIAELWRTAYKETDWDNCMNCEELTECIQPLLDALNLSITNNILNQQQYGTQNPGQPLSGEESEANIAEGTNPLCDLNVLWAQCLAIIEQTNIAIVDVLEKVEVATNVNELAGLIDAIPMLGFIAKAIGTEAVTDTINYFQEAVTEEYLAQFTEGVKISLACQLFCACSDDCILSVDRLCDMLSANVAGIIPTTPSDLLDLIEIIAGVDFDGSEVVNVCFWFAWQGAKVASFFFGESFIQTTFNLLVQLAVNDANNDWTLLCDCPDVWTYLEDSATLPVWVTFPAPSWGVITDNEITGTNNVVFSQSVTGIHQEIVFPDVQEIRNLRISQASGSGIEGTGVVNRFIAYYDEFDTLLYDDELPIQNGAWESNFGARVTGVKKIVMQYLFIDAPTAMIWDAIEITGMGATNPFV